MISLARRWGPWAALVVIALAVLIVGVQRSGGQPSVEARTEHIASEVRCPVCNGETVAQSQAAPSVQIRNEIKADLQKGQSEGQILSSLVASYGPGILEKPQAKGVSLLVWVLPVVGVVVGAAGLLAVFRRWRRAGPAPALSPMDDRELVAVPAALGALVSSPVTAGGPAGTAPGSAVAGSAVAGSAVPGSAVAGSAVPDAPASAGSVAPGAPASPARVALMRRKKAALACVGVILVAGGASWAVAASSGTRLPGQTITGQALGAQAEAAALQTAQTDENKNDIVDAVKQYQKVIASDPKQVQALSGEGWLLAETGQPDLLKQGLGLLVEAEQVQPDYPAAHLYRGLALLGEADYSDSVPELQWYLAHNPDPQLAPQVQSALAQAKAKAATQAPAPTTAG